MNTATKPIQIFKPGKHVAMSGQTLSFSESDLDATIAAYDPAKHEAPLVVGHPTTDGPAYGWVASLSKEGGALTAQPAQLDSQFAELVSAGRFKKISASFYHPESTTNPVPGVYYLRHVGFLGAQAPAVKGLKNPEFAANEDGVVTLEFGEYGFGVVADVLRRLREWIIGSSGQVKADELIPNWQIDTLTEIANRPEPDPAEASITPANLPSFAEANKQQGTSMTPEQQAMMDNLKKENERLLAEQTAFAEREGHIVAAERKLAAAQHADFCEGLVKAGQLHPKLKESAVALLSGFSGDAVVEFSEGDGVVKKPAIETMKGFLSGLPKYIELGELAGTDQGDIKAPEKFTVPAGFSVDPAQLELHHKALAYAEKNECSYEVAITAVSQ